MKKQYDLFELIQSLTASEKRYFKVFASLHTIGEKNDYVKLFEVIDNLKKYDEAEIIRMHSHETFTKHYRASKYYLYQLILKCLRTYHAKISMGTQIKDGIKDIEILYNKGLYNQCKRIIKKTKQLALSYEKYLDIIELIDWEYKLMSVSYFSGYTDDELKDYVEQEQVALNNIKEIYDYKILFMQFYIPMLRKGFIRRPEELHEIEEIYKNTLLLNEDKEMPFEAKRVLLNTHYLYHYAKKDVVNSSAYLQKIITLIEQHPNLSVENPSFYVMALSNYIIHLDLLKKWSEIPHYVNALRSTPPKSVNDRLMIATFSSMHELHLFLVSGEFDKGLEIIPYIENILHEFNAKMDIASKVLFYFNIAYLFFGAKKYKDSLKWINQIFNMTERDLRKDIHNTARILNLILHYELGNHELLQYLERSAHRFLVKRKGLFKAEEIVLEFMRKTFPKVETKKQLVNAFIELKQQLVSITQDTFEQKLLSYFNIISWVDSKIEGKSFGEVVREKAKAF